MDRSSSPPRVASALALLAPLAWSLPEALSAQDPELPTPEEIEARALAAESAPLFASHDPLVMTLWTRIDWLRDERPTEEEADGTVTYLTADGSEVTLPVQVRTRGNFRNQKRNCRFPPLRLDFPRGDVEGTVFEGQNRIDLVTPCNDERDDYQQYIYQEYLVYRTMEFLTPLSRRVRLVEITYEDTDGEYETRTKHAFFAEEEERMAHRNRGELIEVPQLHPATMDPEQEMFASLFSFMIGNTDYSPAFFHNVRLVRSEDGRYLVVPYDFDFSGVVNARYATVDPRLQDRIDGVTDRLYRGFCRPGLTRDRWAPVFNERRQAIRELYQGFGPLDEDEREDALDFYEEFYEVIDDDGRFEREIVRACREIPA